MHINYYHTDHVCNNTHGFCGRSSINGHQSPTATSVMGVPGLWDVRFTRLALYFLLLTVPSYCAPPASVVPSQISQLWMDSNAMPSVSEDSALESTPVFGFTTLRTDGRERTRSCEPSSSGVLGYSVSPCCLSLYLTVRNALRRNGTRRSLGRPIG